MPVVIAAAQYLAEQTGGAERYIQATTARLKRRGMRIVDLATDADAKTGLSRRIPLFSGGCHPLWGRQVDKFLHKVQPDVIYGHFSVPGLLDVTVRMAAQHGIPICIMYHSDVTGPEWYKHMVGNLYHRLFGKKTLRRADGILVSSRKYLAVSPWLADLNTEIRVAPPGVDLTMAQGVRHPGRPYLLFVGKPAIQSKGFAVLYQAWQLMKMEFPALDLVVAGAFSDPSRYPGVIFLGQVSSRQKLADLYASASVTVLPSTSTAESFGMVLAESLVAGTPVIGSEIGGLSELVAPGENGFLVPPGNVPALAHAVSTLLRELDLFRSRVLLARVSNIRRFDWERTTDTVEQMLRDCINNRNRLP